MNTTEMTDAEIREAGWQALIEKLGPAGAVRFALQTERGSGDYAALREQLLGSASVDDLVSRMREERRQGKRSAPRKAKATPKSVRRTRPAV